MTWNIFTRRTKSIELLRTLRAVLGGPKKINAERRERLTRVGQQQRLTLAEIDEVLDDTGDKTKAPADEQARMETLYYLVFLMKSEPTLEPEEEESIKHFGELLGFREDVMTDFIKLANKYKNSDVPMADMVARIKRFVDNPPPPPEEVERLKQEKKRLKLEAAEKAQAEREAAEKEEEA